MLGFAPAEIATALDATPAAIYSALQRAHQAVEERLPQRSQQATLHAIGDDRLRELVERYVAAWERNDVDAIVSMLAEDASFSMPPRPSWYRGRAAIAEFLAAHPLSRPRRWRLVPVRANAQPAFAVYLGGRAHGIELLTLDADARITAVDAFHLPDAFARFDLPEAAQ